MFPQKSGKKLWRGFWWFPFVVVCFCGLLFSNVNIQFFCLKGYVCFSPGLLFSCISKNYVFFGVSYVVQIQKMLEQKPSFVREARPVIRSNYCSSWMTALDVSPVGSLCMWLPWWWLLSKGRVFFLILPFRRCHVALKWANTTLQGTAQKCKCFRKMPNQKK